MTTTMTTTTTTTTSAILTTSGIKTASTFQTLQPNKKTTKTAMTSAKSNNNSIRKIIQKLEQRVLSLKGNTYIQKVVATKMDWQIFFCIYFTWQQCIIY